MSGSGEVIYKCKFVELCLKNHWYEYVHVGTGKAVTVVGFKQKKGNLYILGRYLSCP